MFLNSKVKEKNEYVCITALFQFDQTFIPVGVALRFDDFSKQNQCMSNEIIFLPYVLISFAQYSVEC